MKMYVEASDLERLEDTVEHKGKSGVLGGEKGGMSFRIKERLKQKMKQKQHINRNNIKITKFRLKGMMYRY